jgi:hypothetical protein
MYFNSSCNYNKKKYKVFYKILFCDTENEQYHDTAPAPQNWSVYTGAMAPQFAFICFS